MNHPGDCKSERPDRDRHSCVQRCQARRVSQFEMLIPNVSPVDAAADHPRRHSPYALVGGQSGQSADKEVDDAKKKGRAKPLTT